MNTANDGVLSDSTPLALSRGPTAAAMPGEIVVLDPKAGRYYGLDQVGARVWELLGARTTFGDVKRALLEEFDVNPERLDRDLRVLLSRMKAARLVEWGDAAHP